MARPKGTKNKKKVVEKVVEKPELLEIVEEKIVKSPLIPDITEKSVEVKTEPKVIEDDSGLENRPFFSVDEAARYLNVNPACAQLWFDHGHLCGTEDQGFVQISRESILEVKSGPLLDGHNE